MHRQKDITNFLNNPRTIYIGGTVLPRKSVIETIPAIKTHISQNHIKGPGYWRMNRSLLDDNNNQRYPRLRLKCLSVRQRADVTCRITGVFGIGLSIVLEHMQYSFQNVKQKKKKKIRRTYCKMNLTMQRKRSNVTLPIKMQATLGILIRRKENWNIFMKKNFKVSSFAHGRDGVNTAKRVRNIFSIWRKGTTSKNMCEN